MSTTEKEYKPVDIIRGMLRPLTAQATANTSYTVESDPGMHIVIIPKAYLVTTTTASILLTLTTGVASADTVIIPIGGSGDGLTSGDLIFNIYVDDSGNISGSDYTISGYVAGRGWWQKDSHRTLTQRGCTVGQTGSTQYGVGMIYPIPFIGGLPDIGAFSHRSGGAAASINVYSQSESTNGFTFVIDTPSTSQTCIGRYIAVGRW